MREGMTDREWAQAWEQRRWDQKEGGWWVPYDEDWDLFVTAHPDPDPFWDQWPGIERPSRRFLMVSKELIREAFPRLNRKSPSLTAVFMWFLLRFDEPEPLASAPVPIRDIASAVGLHRDTIITAIAGLEARGLIHSFHHRHAVKGYVLPNSYRGRGSGERRRKPTESEIPTQWVSRTEIPRRTMENFAKNPPDRTEFPSRDLLIDTDTDTETETARACAREDQFTKGAVEHYADQDVEDVYIAWASGMPPGVTRSRTVPRRRAITGAFGRGVPKLDCLDAVLGWRWDTWGGRRNNNDLEDCLRPANLERFRDWQRGINRPSFTDDIKLDRGAARRQELMRRIAGDQPHANHLGASRADARGPLAQPDVG